MVSWQHPLGYRFFSLFQCFQWFFRYRELEKKPVSPAGYRDEVIVGEMAKEALGWSAATAPPEVGASAETRRESLPFPSTCQEARALLKAGEKIVSDTVWKLSETVVVLL